MRGCQVLMQTFLAHGVEKIFGNPGTTESPLLDSLSDYPQIEYIVALQESIAASAANHYAQASGKTGIVNVHVAPGLGNAIGMMYSALKANTPMIITAGQQDTRGRLNEPVLSHDLVAMAAPVTKWSVQVESADEMAPILRRAFKVAHEAPAGPVFVALPINVMAQETDVVPAVPDRLFPAGAADAAGLGELAELLAQASAPVLIVGDDVGRTGALAQMVDLAEATGADVWQELQHMHLGFPTSHAAFRGSLGSDTATIAKTLDGADLVLMVGGNFFDDVWFTPGAPFPDTAKVCQIEESGKTLAYKQRLDLGLVGAIPATLSALTAAVQALKPDAIAIAARNAAMAERKAAEIESQKSRAERSWDRRPTSMARVMTEINSAMPDNVIVVDESITASIDLTRSLQLDNSGDYYGTRGGGIGQGVGGAFGVLVAQPKRPVLCISGDGSSMYSIQALWSAAHHELPIVFIILANREYRVLKHNMDIYRQRFDAATNKDYPEMNLTGPDLDFVTVAKGFGLTASRIDDPDELGAAIQQAFAEGKPALLEVTIEGKA
jgi:benzoylformate decarboxylase